ncbi:ABC transporter ATP-binding protein [Glaciimonas sp. PAMC28666]|uniref:ABC transporter ATP-binding protein n=1 Tax=Glaciimonas sp. PAMC28666 TaxID=2807626 RepID=UPI001962F58F|nr:ABC transporter ATP-binding protein [Glaciimonas sp. PAMC28666]QRX81062.1 ABC transporter ATP-binding protein [Glaciimonas sp. PAMC28666]
MITLSEINNEKNKALLDIESLHMRFQGLSALDDVSFTAQAGEITSLIGPNGAGKTTLFNCVTGMYRPTAGKVIFNGADITAKPAHQVSRHGVARTFQNLALFGGLSVMDNLLVGAYRQGSSGLLQGAVTSGRARAEQRAAFAAATEVLEFLGMPDIADALPGELPYGRQKQVEFARALMQKARLVLLDEPMAGMSSAEKSAMTELIMRVRAQFGVSFLIVEHDIPVIMDISDKIVVLDFGRKIAEGTPREVQANPTVITAYLGTEHNAAAEVA